MTLKEIKCPQWGPPKKAENKSCFEYKSAHQLITLWREVKGGILSLGASGTFWANQCGEVWIGHVLASNWCGGGGGSGLMPDSVFLWGSSPLWPTSTPSLSLPPLSYCQTSSPGKGESSSNNVLVDLTKRIELIETFYNPDLSHRLCMQSCALCLWGHTDNSRSSLNNLSPFLEFARGVFLF